MMANARALEVWRPRRSIERVTDWGGCSGSDNHLRLSGKITEVERTQHFLHFTVNVLERGFVRVEVGIHGDDK